MIHVQCLTPVSMRCTLKRVFRNGAIGATGIPTRVYYILPVYCQLSHGVLGEVLLPHGLQTTLICARRWARLRVAGQGLD